jgi:hypothetical protein
MDFEKKESNMMLDNMKQCNQNLNNKQIISKSIHHKPSHHPHLTRNPYDDGSLKIFI